MTRQIAIEWPDAGITVNATLLEKEEPELSNMLWDALATPQKMFCRHTLSSGHLFIGWGRPPKHPVTMGSQRAPVGRKQWLLSRLGAGTVFYDGMQINIVYGPEMTEPLPAGGSVVANVNDEDLGKLMKAGNAVWDAMMMRRHLIMIARRKE